MPKSFSAIRAKLNEDTAAEHVGRGGNVPSPSSLQDGTPSTDIDAGTLADFNKWLRALSAHDWDHFPSQEIEERLRFHGFTAYLDEDYMDDEEEASGEEVIIVYSYANNDIAHNVVINISWTRDCDGWHLDASCDVVTSDQIAYFQAQLDDGLSTGMNEEVHPSNNIKSAHGHTLSYKLNPKEYETHFYKGRGAALQGSAKSTNPHAKNTAAHAGWNSGHDHVTSKRIYEGVLEENSILTENDQPSAPEHTTIQLKGSHKINYTGRAMHHPTDGWFHHYVGHDPHHINDDDEGERHYAVHAVTGKIHRYNK